MSAYTVMHIVLFEVPVLSCFDFVVDKLSLNLVLIVQVIFCTDPLKCRQFVICLQRPHSLCATDK